MKLSSKARYAVKAMLELALSEKGEPVTLAEMTDHQGISLSYLEQLFAQLRRAGLVAGMRGPGGGYRLARSAADISIAEIVAAVDCKAFTRRPPNMLSRLDRERSQYFEMWGDLSDQFRRFLSGISLAELVEREDVQAVLHGRGDMPSSVQGGGTERAA